MPAPELLGEARTLDCRPGLYEPGQLDRVIACGFHSTIADQVAVLDATRFVEAPAECYRFSDVVLLGGEAFHAGGRALLAVNSPYRALRAPIAEFDVAACPGTLQGVGFFGHWLRDDCPGYELARDMAPVAPLRRPEWRDAPAYEAAFGQDWTPREIVFARRLLLIREIGFNRAKARRLGTLRERLRQSCSPLRRGHAVYMKRGHRGARRAVANEAALIAALEAAGVLIVEPDIDGDELIRTCLDAELMISVEGSQVAHAAYCLAEGGSVLVLQPPERFYNPHHEWARLLGMRYGTVIGLPAAGGFDILPGEVFAMIDRLQAPDGTS